MYTSVSTSAVLAVLLAAALGNAQQGAKGGDWRYHSGDLGSTKYSALDQINKANVSQLTIAWRRPAVDVSISQQRPGLNYAHDFHATPIMIDGVLYFRSDLSLFGRGQFGELLTERV